MFAYALDCAVYGSATLEVRLDRVCLVLDEETCQYADTLRKISDRIYGENGIADCMWRWNARMSTRRRDLHYGIHISFLRDTRDGDGGALYVSI